MLSQQKSNIHGILWMAIMALMGAGCVVTIRLLSDGNIPASQLVFFEIFFALICLTPFLITKKITLTTSRTRLYVIRSILEYAGWSCSFVAIGMIALPIHTALSYMTPLFLHTAAVIILREQASIHRWIAFCIGIAGVMLILHPWSRPLETNHLLYIAAGLMCISSSCFCACGVIIKKLTTTESPLTITFYMAFFTSILAIPLAMYQWVNPTPTQWGIAFLAGLFSVGQQFAVTKAFAKADITVVLPVSATLLIYSSIFAYIFFDEIVDSWTVFGATMIFSGVLYAIYHARRPKEELV